MHENSAHFQKFSELYVHEHPTEWRNYYQVLTLDFSQVSGESKNLQITPFSTSTISQLFQIFTEIMFLG